MAKTLGLFDVLPLPPWWTPEDADVVRAYRDEEVRAAAFPEAPDGDPENPAWNAELEAFCESLHPRSAEYTCRRCEFWSSPDGQRGECTMPETPRTLNCGTTLHWQGCEQWEPLPPSP